MTAPLLCAFCPETFRSEKNALWHEIWCGIEGGETRVIPGISLVSGTIGSIEGVGE